MIRFSCPICRAVLSVDDNRAGRKAPCPKCGQRLQVPFPVRNKTVLGKPVAAGGIADALAPEPSLPAGVVYNDRPPRKWLGPVLLAFLFVACSLGAAMLGLRLLSYHPLAAGGSSHDDQAARDSSHAGDAAGSDEQRVHDWIIEHADDPKSVAFASWGPHDLTGECRDLTEQFEKNHPNALGLFAPLVLGKPLAAQSDKVLRVCFRVNNQYGRPERRDWLVFVRERPGEMKLFGVGGKIAPLPNLGGDDWLIKIRAGAGQ